MMEIPGPNETVEITIKLTSSEFVKLVDAVNLVDYFTHGETDNIADVMQQINSTPRRQLKVVTTMAFMANFIRGIVGPRIDIRRSVERELEREEP